MAEVAEIIKKSGMLEIPLGQRLLQAGFKYTTKDRLHKALKCDGLTKEKFKTDLEEMKQIYPIVKVSDYYIKGYSNRLHKFMDVCQGYKRRKVAKIAMEPIDLYIEKEIPARCLQEVARAKELGADNFWVVFPTFESLDPIIIAKLGNKNVGRNYIYITHWGPETGE